MDTSTEMLKRNGLLQKWNLPTETCKQIKYNKLKEVSPDSLTAARNMSEVPLHIPSTNWTHQSYTNFITNHTTLSSFVLNTKIWWYSECG